MADFNYSNDIAPLKGNYFSGRSYSRGMSQDELAGIQEQEISNLERQNAMRLNSIKTSNAIRESELKFLEQELALRKAKDDARIERDALLAIPEVTKQLTSVLNDPSTDDSVKTAQISELKFRNVNLATTSRTVNNLFTAAEGTIEARKADRDKVNSLINPLVQSGQPEALRKVLEGRNVPMTEEYIVVAEAVNASKQEAAQQRGAIAQQKELMKRETAQQTAQIGLLNNYMETLRRLAPQEAAVGGEIGTLKGGPTTTTVPQAQPFKFAPENRIELEEMMRDLNPMLENEDLSKYSDDNLYRSAVRSTTSSLKKLSGFDSGFRSDKFRSTPPE
jgi:hypothetical protein